MYINNNLLKSYPFVISTQEPIQCILNLGNSYV